MAQQKSVHTIIWRFRVWMPQPSLEGIPRAQNWLCGKGGILSFSYWSLPSVSSCALSFKCVMPWRSISSSLKRCSLLASSVLEEARDSICPPCSVAVIWSGRANCWVGIGQDYTRKNLEAKKFSGFSTQRSTCINLDLNKCNVPGANIAVTSEMQSLTYQTVCILRIWILPLLYFPSFSLFSQNLLNFLYILYRRPDVMCRNTYMFVAYPSLIVSQTLCLQIL